MTVMKTQRYCPKCHRMYCEGDWGEGVCSADIGWCSDATANFDEAGRCLRAWYEAHRETWWDRRRRREECADEFMLGLINEVQRILDAQSAAERRRRGETTT